MKSLIYKITSKTTGKHYIGQTKNSLKQRIYGHTSSVKGKSNFHIHNAIRKYGIETFEISILKNYIPIASDIVTKQLLSDMEEIYYIKKFNSYKNGYNMDIGGGTRIGYKTTNKTREKISKALKGKKKKPFSEEHKENIRKSRIGTHLSEATKQKLSKKIKGQKLRPRSTEQKRKYAKKIGIFDNKDELLLISENNFEDFCKINNLPFKQFKKSYQNYGEAIYLDLSNASMSALNRFKQLHYYFKYKGWYSRLIS